MRFILFLLMLIGSNAFAGVNIDIPEKFTLMCNPGAAAVELHVLNSLDSVYDCRESAGSAIYTPRGVQLDIDLGVNRYVGEVQPFTDSGHCQTTLDYVNIYLRNDVTRYIAALHSNGDATVSRLGTPLCFSGPHTVPLPPAY